MAELKLALIDSNAEMPTRRKTSNSHRERLNERAPEVGDVIVRSHTNRKYERIAEMTILLLVYGSDNRKTGLLYATPNGGNLPTNPSPVSLLLQEVTIDFKGDLKKLYTQYQFPIATARGKISVDGKAKIVNYDPYPINQLFWAQSVAAGIEIPINLEAQTIPAASPFTAFVTNNATFGVDHGVTYTTGTTSGQMFLNVSPAFPTTAGTYTVNTTSGKYQFASVDNAVGVGISYTYTNATRGATIALTTQLMGYAPTCVVDVWANFRNKILGMRLNSVTFGSWTYPSKLEDLN